MKKSINDYIKRRVSELNKSGICGDEAHAWLISEIKYYTRPAYKHTDYTKEVLKQLNEIINIMPKNTQSHLRNATLLLIVNAKENT